MALSSVIDVPPDFHQGYFDAAGEMVNPWGGVEAMLTHTLSSMYDIPTAHSPMFESQEIANMDPGSLIRGWPQRPFRRPSCSARSRVYGRVLAS